VAVLTAAVVVLAIPATAGARPAANQRAEADMLDAINEVRHEHGLYALRKSKSLGGSARRYSTWLMANDTFRHLSSIQASSRFSMLGEALAMHSGRRFGVRSTIDQWMNSPPHRALVLTAAMRWVGTGVTRGSFGASPSTIWVLHLGRLQPPGTSPPGLPSPTLPLPG
jgi:uncharacterized protein YkwD